MTHFRGWLLAGPLVLAVATAATVFGQGRQAQTPAPSTPATTPGGRGARGGVPGQGPAVGGEVDEAPVVPGGSRDVGGVRCRGVLPAGEAGDASRPDGRFTAGLMLPIGFHRLGQIDLSGPGAVFCRYTFTVGAVAKW
jgi:hypothetical protein